MGAVVWLSKCAVGVAGLGVIRGRRGHADTISAGIQAVEDVVAVVIRVGRGGDDIIAGAEAARRDRR